ncbi:MAG: DEAD/DEAH box helicase [Lachnospiraceae bacterium]|nr:DEAD/DEAH box helicase [Lachnospiraceae bacterium]
MIKRTYKRADIREMVKSLEFARNTVAEGRKLNGSLTNDIRKAVDLVADKEYLKILKTIPIDEINADKSGIRIGVLKDNGFQTVFDILRADIYRLSSVHGIGENMASRAKVIAQRIGADIKRHVKIRINSDDRNPEYTELVRSVAVYLRAKAGFERCDELESRIPADADTDLKIIRRGSNPIKWLFIPEALMLEAVETYRKYSVELKALDTESISDELQAVGRITNEQAWEDFSANSVLFYNILENLVPEHFSTTGDGYGLNDEIRGEVESTELDLTGIKCQLRGYQVWGVKYILRRQKVLLGDEMGLGKTIQALASIVHLRNVGMTHFLVICPASVIINWCREIESKSDLNVIKIHATFKDLAFTKWKEEGGVAVTNYESLAGLINMEPEFRIGMVVVDEAHYVKNESAKRSKNVMDICTHTDRILFMTGTPIENNVDEMLRLLGYLQPRVAEDARRFSTTAYADSFKEKISPVYYRRKREDVLAELPELIQMQEWCNMTPEDERQYIRDVMNRNFMDARRVSWRNPDYLNTSSKVMRLKEIVDLACGDGRKILVFSFFLDTLQKVSDIFGPMCVGIINGSVSPDKRQEIIDRFDNAPPGCVLAAQIQSGGTGLNIQSASVVVICEPQYKPSIESQAISRAYRMGQTRNVLVHRLLCTNTIEERIMQILWAKQEEFNTFADDSTAARLDMELDNNAINSMIEDEIRRIREKYTEEQLNLLTG